MVSQKYFLMKYVFSANNFEEMDQGTLNIPAVLQNGTYNISITGLQIFPKIEIS
jgi:hypothetical protein